MFFEVFGCVKEQQTNSFETLSSSGHVKLGGSFYGSLRTPGHPLHSRLGLTHSVFSRKVSTLRISAVRCPDPLTLPIVLAGHNSTLCSAITGPYPYLPGAAILCSSTLSSRGTTPLFGSTGHARLEETLLFYAPHEIRRWRWRGPR